MSWIGRQFISQFISFFPKAHSINPCFPINQENKKPLFRMSKKQFAIFILSLAGSSTAFAQTQKDSTVKALDQVVVTATRYPVKENLTGKVLTVITKEQLEKSGGRQLTEVLNTQAGVIIGGAQNPLGTTQSVYIQGA